jgi:hypothetical protein
MTARLKWLWFIRPLGFVLGMACGGSITSVGDGGTDGSGGSAGHGGSAGSGGTGGSGGTAGSGGMAGSGGTGGGGGSDAACGECMPTFICCEGKCVNPNNDIHNCGMCGHTCKVAPPYCDMGKCGTPPCENLTCSTTSTCCGDNCCTAGELCCNIPGPVVTNSPTCAPPVDGTCPGGCTGCVCASPDTPIATPNGDRPIAELAVGDLVYSVDHDAVVTVPIVQVNRTPVHDHRVVRVHLASGALLEISPGHPTADGRTFADLHAGDTLDQVGVASAELVPYRYGFTYDILPDSSTHAYFAGGALIGSTLAPRREPTRE